MHPLCLAVVVVLGLGHLPSKVEGSGRGLLASESSSSSQDVASLAKTSSPPPIAAKHSPPPTVASPPPKPLSAAEYLDSLFADHAAARVKLSGNFIKSSKVAVIYMCYERGDIIRSTIASVLRSEGLADFDFFISQDGGSNYVLDVALPANISSLHIRHPVNLCTGQHHYFVKRFAFEIMGYETLIIVEEDNILHPQALQMLRRVIDQSVDDKEVGLVSIVDMDNSILFNETLFSSAILRTEVFQGHLWVYALHSTRYQAVRQHLNDYYNVIRGQNYRSIDVPPLRDSIVRLLRDKGFPAGMPLSQDAFFVHSLEKEGYTRRLTTMVRLFEPMGWQGLHFHQDPTSFYSLYGKGMYEGRVDGKPFEVTKDPLMLLQLADECRARLDRVYQQYLGRFADEGASKAAVTRLVTGKLNAVELVRNVVNSAEHRRRMKEWVNKGKRLRATSR